MKQRRTIKLLPRNDETCGWINMLGPRAGFPSLQGKLTVDWAVIGGGYTGLAFARQMAAQIPDHHIAVLDAARIGEGASARNSGFAVATSSMDMPYDPARLGEFKRINRINKAGIDLLRDVTAEQNIDCQWREIGKYHCGADQHTDGAADNFVQWLDAANIEYEELSADILAARLGSSWYRRAVHTKSDVMLQPAALVRGLAESLPKNVSLFDHAPVREIEMRNNGIELTCPSGKVRAKNLILASNAFLHAMTPSPSHTIPLTLSASLTRPLNPAEQAEIGNPDDWGILSLAKLGATLRYTGDHRILIRNTADYRASAHLNAADMQTARARHESCLRQRFPALTDLSFEHSWQGALCVSRNQAVLFGKLAERIYGAGCYNASGIARGSALGHGLADYVLGRATPLVADILDYPAPKWIPPRPILDLIMKTEIRRQKSQSGNDG